MVVNAKTHDTVPASELELDLDLTGDRNRELEAEIDHLRDQLRIMSDKLAVERARRRMRSATEPDNRSDDRSSDDSNIYVFDDEDESRAAFDDFFGAHDPHLEKVRGFLLD